MRKKKVRVMKRIYAALFFLTTLALFSCSKDDFDLNDYEKNILGEWRLVHEYRWRRYPGREPVISEIDETKNKIIYTFKENGSLMVLLTIYPSESNGPSWNTEGEMMYKIVDGRIVIDGDYETAEKILSLTQTELKTEVRFIDVVGNTSKEVYSIYTYKKQ